MVELATSAGGGSGKLFLASCERWCQTVTRPIAFIGVIGMLAVSGVTVLDVLLRWFASSGVTALNEIVSMTFAVAVTACIPSGLARGVNLMVDILAHLLSRRMVAWLQASGAVLLFAFYAVLSWRMGVFATTLLSQHRATVILGLPQGPFMMGASILLGLGALVQAVVAANKLYGAMADNRASVSAPIEPSIRPSAVTTSITLLVGAVFVALVALCLFDFPAVSGWAGGHEAGTIAIAFVVMWASLMLLFPLAAVMGTVGVVGAATLIGVMPALGAFATECAGFLTNYEVASLPLFLMMGSFAAVAGISGDVYRLAQAVVGSLRGGLALATIAGCAGFGAVTGSSLATVATFGRVSLPEMRSRGYSPSIATGCVAAGGTLGALIPPSGPLIIFALLSEASIGQLFVAAIIPGLLATALYVLTIILFVRFVPTSVPPAVKMQGQELLSAIRQCGAVTILFGAVIGGMYTGIFTATEAAAVGAFLAFAIALIRGRLHGGVFWDVMAEVTASTAMIYGLIFGAVTFSLFVGTTSLTERATAFIGSLGLPALAVVAAVLVVYVALGCIMDSFAVMVITVPIVTPMIVHMGFDVLWWGVLNLVVVETSMITPPFGLNVFVLKSLVPDVPMGTIFRGVLAFCAADFVKLVLLVLFPALALWLPSTMFH